MTVGENLYYYYMPLSSGPLLSTTTILGNFNSKRDILLEDMLYKFTNQEINFVDILSAELDLCFQNLTSLFWNCQCSRSLQICNWIWYR